MQNGAKERYKERLCMEAPKKIDPFYNVVEGPKISSISVNGMLKIRSHIG